jgi:hypothetical protein
VRTLALLLCVAVPAYAADDAPVLEKPAALSLKAGEASPYDGTLLVAPNDETQAKRIAGCEASLGECKKQVTGPAWVPIVVTAAIALALGCAGGIAIGAVAARK